MVYKKMVSTSDWHAKTHSLVEIHDKFQLPCAVLQTGFDLSFYNFSFLSVLCGDIQKLWMQKSKCHDFWSKVKCCELIMRCVTLHVMDPISPCNLHCFLQPEQHVYLGIHRQSPIFLLLIKDFLLVNKCKHGNFSSF